MRKTETYWQHYEPMIKAIVELFNPFVEVAVHDLKKGKIVALYHNISQRKVGELSPLKELKIDTEHFPDLFTPYYKKNWDGRPLKCTSITIRDDQGTPVGLICVNVDTSFFQDAHRFLNLFLKTEKSAENPIEMFGSQCDEQAIALIQQYLEERHLSLAYLNRDQKKELVQYLYHKGIFNFKNAAPFLATYLSVSRASIYNYIKQIGE